MLTSVTVLTVLADRDVDQRVALLAGEVPERELRTVRLAQPGPRVGADDEERARAHASLDDVELRDLDARQVRVRLPSSSAPLTPETEAEEDRDRGEDGAGRPQATAAPATPTSAPQASRSRLRIAYLPAGAMRSRPRMTTIATGSPSKQQRHVDGLDDWRRERSASRNATGSASRSPEGS
jgi:hypothetical protein